ncbi:MAG: hypothetical protein JXA38_04060 [Methanosarcinaceae archaeon]|nr:hypothetical protein [Methanosarcinaceae archaeon]
MSEFIKNYLKTLNELNHPEQYKKEVMDVKPPEENKTHDKKKSSKHEVCNVCGQDARNKSEIIDYSTGRKELMLLHWCDFCYREYTKTGVYHLKKNTPPQEETVKKIKTFVTCNKDQESKRISRKYQDIAFDFCKAHKGVYDKPSEIKELIEKMAECGEI